MAGLAVPAAVVLSALAVLVLMGRGGNERLSRTMSASTARRGPPVRLPPARAACVLAGIAAALLVTGWVGLVLGAALGWAGPRLLGRLEPAERRAEREQLVSDLPLLLDLLASCLTGGAPLPAAAKAVAQAVPGPAGRRLSAVCAALAVGSPPAEAWAALARDPSGGVGAGDEDPLAATARALGRAADGGAPVAGAVSRLAADARAQGRSRGEQAARRVGVLAVAPLGLCFLPAFVLIGIVPVVAGLAGPLLASF